MSTKRLVVSGRVQGVGYRDWAVAQARALGLAGWVRNCGRGGVELLVDGETDAVEEMVRACRRGPRGAEVTAIDEEMAEPPEEQAFLRLPAR